MGNGPHHAMGRPRQHAGVRVQGNHVPIPPGNAPAGLALRGKFPRFAADQPPQSHQRPGLSGPAPENAVRRRFRAAPVQIKIFLSSGPAVHFLHAFPHRGENFPVAGHVLLRRVREIPQQQIIQIFVLLQTAQRLQIFTQLPAASGRGNQHRQRHQCAPVLRQGFVFHLQNRPGPAQPGARLSHPCPRQPPDRRGQGKGPPEGPRQRTKAEGQQRKYPQKQRPIPCAPGVGNHPGQWLFHAHAPGQRPAALVLINPPADSAPNGVLPVLPGGGNRIPGHGGFSHPQPPGQTGHLPPQGAAGIRRHGGIRSRRVLPQFRLRGGNGLEGLLPVRSLQHPDHGRNAVDAHQSQPPPLLCQPHTGVRGRVCPSQCIFYFLPHLRLFHFQGQLQRTLIKGGAFSGNLLAPAGINPVLRRAPVPGGPENALRRLLIRPAKVHPHGFREGPVFRHGQPLHLIEGHQPQLQIGQIPGAQVHQRPGHPFDAGLFPAGGQPRSALQRRALGAGLHQPHATLQMGQHVHLSPPGKGRHGIGQFLQSVPGLPRQTQPHAALRRQLRRQLAHLPAQPTPAGFVQKSHIPPPYTDSFSMRHFGRFIRPIKKRPSPFSGEARPRLSKNPWRAREGQSPLEFQSCPAACTVGTGGFLRRKIPFSRAKIVSLQFLRPEI